MKHFTATTPILKPRRLALGSLGRYLSCLGQQGAATVACSGQSADVRVGKRRPIDLVDLRLAHSKCEIRCLVCGVLPTPVTSARGADLGVQDRRHQALSKPNNNMPSAIVLG